MQKKVTLLLVVAILILLGEELPIDGNFTKEPQGASVIGATNANVSSSFVPVVRTVDGDTLVVSLAGKDEKVRLIGVDTPESVDPRKKVECFGKEASAFTKNLLEGKSVRLEIDPTQGERDKYQRLIRYVFLEDGTLLNKKIIADGYGHEYTYRTPYQYQTEFKSAQNEARMQKRGLWAEGACARER